MAAYIEREAALRVLCDACGNAACPKGLIPRCSYYEKMQSIPAADVRPVEWIPVEERLPEENGRYLARYKRDIVLDYVEVHDDEVRIMKFFVDDGWRYPFLCQPELRKAEQQTVTHWMALPNLPAEENANG